MSLNSPCCLMMVLMAVAIGGVTHTSLIPAAQAQDAAFSDPPWRYRLQRPAKSWLQPDFDDSQWRHGPGGFGTRDTPGSRVGTTWRTNRIWLRRTVHLERVPAKPALYMHHDEDVEVYINGRQVFSRQGYITQYQLFRLDEDAASAIKQGDNVIAVHCRQTGGGQFVDVHLVDADHVPQLPAPQRPDRPFQSKLITTWGADVTADNAWTEYPRPQLVRDDWQNLNGYWNYAITKRNETATPTDWDGQILVPFCLESRLSGVQKLLDADETLWYQRTVSLQPEPNRRTLIHFEAVDYRCELFVNGHTVGQHIGGNTPFSFDITDQLRTGDNTLLLRVEDDTEAYQLRGKQVLDPRGIWYTQVSGIWQTVWLETVPDRYIEDLTLSTSAAEGTISIAVDLNRPMASGDTLHVTILDGDQTVASGTSPTSQHTVKLHDPKLWSPDSPHLYSLNISLHNATGERVDTVTSYAGIRDVGKERDADGHWRMTLNGEPIFHWGPLDQGWWPDGLLTPPSDEAMLSDIEFLKAAGFNMIRKHIKVEPRRYYAHCDRLGIMIWQDQVSAGNNPPWTRLRPDPVDATWPDEQHEQFLKEFEQMVDSLENHPCIVVWVPFNEAWGQHRTLEVGHWIEQRDPTRLVNIASGGNFWPVGDIVDHHNYPHPDFPFDESRFAGFVKVIGEFGGHGFPVRDHLWDADRRNWGYGGLPETKAEYRERYVESIRRLKQFQQQGIAAGVYTQTTDVEGEINGLLTYDRKVIKIPAEELRQIHKQLFTE